MKLYVLAGKVIGQQENGETKVFISHGVLDGIDGSLSR